MERGTCPGTRRGSLEVFIQPSRRVSCPGTRSGGLEVFVQPSRRVSLRWAFHMAQTRSPSTVS